MAESKPNDLPEDFQQIPDQEQEDIPQILEAERWRAGAKVVYLGVRTWAGGRGETFRAHAVMGENDEQRVAYGIWCTAVLDRLLAVVPSGELVFIRYDGMQPHATMTDRSIHKWTVARSKAKPAAPAPAPAAPQGLPFA